MPKPMTAEEHLERLENYMDSDAMPTRFENDLRWLIEEYRGLKAELAIRGRTGAGGTC